MKHPFKTTLCKGCGKPIVFAVTKSGALMPCDPVPIVYWVYRNPGEEAMARQIEPTLIEQLQDYRECAFPMVSHFTTCAKANTFSKGQKP